jgi:GNAT superfamily N-acetyltransferase
MVSPALPSESVRFATLEDAAAIARIHVLSWQVGYDGIMPAELLRALSVEQRASFWKELLGRDDESQRAWVAGLDGHLIGFVTAGSSRDEAMDGAAEVYALGVDPAYWGAGAGGALLRAATEWAILRRFNRLALWVLKDNQRARRLYESLGWMPDGHEHQRTFGQAALTEVRYTVGLEHLF